ncbi:MraY family glycosyltransferase [Thermomicrobium sp. 4228-Ro]|uniref:MraY family glycosyltransferase n=1 Tax=Thermomicrobium sp. 4228-Ro TaxID=2993937 RepID=UPI002249055A|nr:MraY family glycosyltransferase [Thermomicrobium sp. 4228-Ro]MCX2726150.1 MraY family glycosyltransferase [Thermomicrobium sp. 4228-Ro]
MMLERACIALMTASVAALVCAFVIPRVIQVAHRFDLLAYPTEARWVHTRPIPRIGGLAIFIGFLSGLALTFMLPVDRFPVEVERIVLLVLGATLVLAAHLYDDLIGLGPVTKLAWQCAGAAVVILPRLRGPDHGLVIEQFNSPLGGVVVLPLVLAVPFTLLWIVGMMNTVNFLDGLDGLAGSVTLIAALVMFLHTFLRPADNPQFTISLLAATLAGSVLGFLIFNWHPARIMMGDSGAMFLGYSLAVLSIIGGAKIATALLVLWVPILDVAWLIIYRLWNGRSPLEADRGHLHHRLLDLGWSQRRIAAAFVSVSAGFGALALVMPGPLYKFIVLIVAGVAGLVVLSWLARLRPISQPGDVRREDVSSA